MDVTAKVVLGTKSVDKEGYATLSFSANYRDDDGNLINQDWAFSTPALNVAMVVNAKTAEHFEQGETYTLSFSKDSTVEPEPPAENAREAQDRDALLSEVEQ